MKPLLSTTHVDAADKFRTAAEHGVEAVELDLTETSLEHVEELLRTAEKHRFAAPTLHYDFLAAEETVQDAVTRLHKAVELSGASHVSLVPPSNVDAVTVAHLSRFANANGCTVSVETRDTYAKIPVLNALVEENPGFTVSLNTGEITQRSAPLKKVVGSVTAPIQKIRVADRFLGESRERVPGTGDIPLNDVFSTVESQNRAPFIVLDLPRFTADALDTAMHHFERTLFSRVPDRLQLVDDVNRDRVNPVQIGEEHG